MSLTIREKADTVATFRFISVYLMETLARWVPTTPELEAKVLFGRQIWDFAQHADALGKRTNELRAALHYTLPPTEPYIAALEALRGATGTMERAAGFYEGFLPTLVRRYRRHQEELDVLLDEPTVRILQRILPDLDRLGVEYAEFRRERPDLALTRKDWPTLIAAEADAPNPFVAFRPRAGALETA
jgi:hypothetical protein